MAGQAQGPAPTLREKSEEADTLRTLLAALEEACVRLDECASWRGRCDEAEIRMITRDVLLKRCAEAVGELVAGLQQLAGLGEGDA